MSGPDGGWGKPPGHQGGSFGPTPPSAFGNAPQQPAMGSPLPAQQPPPPKKKNPMLWAIVLAPVLLCCFSGIGLFAWAGYQQSQYSDLEAACDGGPVASASAYTPGGSNRAAGFKRGTSGTSWLLHNAFVANSRRSSDTASTNLIVCVDDETEERMERCPYDNSAGGVNILDRMRYQRRVRLIAPQTAEVIVDELVYGSEPTACDEWESFAGTGTYERHGGNVADSQIVELVNAHL